MRKVLKVGGVTLGGLLGVLVVYMGLLLYPDASFANHVEYGNFTVHSNEKYGDDLKDALRDVQAALETSAIYDPTLKHDIYFGHDSEFFAALHRVLGITYNLSWPPYVSQVITLREPNFPANALSLPGRAGNTNLRQILTHEIAHTYLRSKLGLAGVARSPMWKQEGYADFVGASTTILSDPGYDIRESVRHILRQDLSWMKDARGNFIKMRYGCAARPNLVNETGSWSPTCYYIGRVLWEYLLNVKRLTFEQVMDPSTTDTDTLNELLEKYGSGAV